MRSNGSFAGANRICLGTIRLGGWIRPIGRLGINPRPPTEVPNDDQSSPVCRHRR